MAKLWRSYGAGSIQTTRTHAKSWRKSLSENVLDDRGDTRCTFVNEITGLNLVLSLFPQVIEFTGDMILQYVQPDLYSKRR